MARANDALLPHASENSRAVPLDRYTANLNHFVSSLHGHGFDQCLPEARILLITPPPFVVSMHLNAFGGLAKLDLEHTRRYKDACKAVGKVWNERTSGRVFGCMEDVG
ncbi:hypothetical protein QFC22_002154 [Naganishia vaughanmartiniae]|uniref:Uncharacterized protein n=1 Tax=Naganishia vaughanmartiniae TaxID=1424756 RepID=A0ACC2XD28_9TREE|nr:hypothetical protein QFC22_002154 [Naganishia vaughanmartiniae]